MVTLTSAQSQDVISRFLSKYQNDDSFTNVNISSKMFSLFMQMEVADPEDQEVLDAISKLKGLKILAKENAANSHELYREALSVIPVSFEELLSLREKEKDVKFMVQESGGKISELLMVVGSPNEFMILSVIGDIDLKQIARIGKRMDIKGLENLQQINKRNVTEPGNDNSRGRQ